MSEFRVATQGLDDIAAWADDIARLCREGYCYCAYSGEDEREEYDPAKGSGEGTVGWYAIMSNTDVQLTYEQAVAILDEEFPIERYEDEDEYEDEDDY